MKGIAMQPSMWVIYDHPADHPDCFVARLWEGDRPTSQKQFAKNLDELRAAMRSRGRTCLPRHKSDDPVIVESWL